MSKLHIGILTERMTMGYGVDLVIHEQATRLVNMGYKVTVFPCWKTDLYQDQPYDIVPLAPVSTEPVHYYSLDFMHHAFDVINEYSINVWIIQTPPFYFWLSHLPAPVIMIEHGTPPGKYFRYREGRFLDRQTRKRQQKCFRTTRTGDGLVAISKYIRSGLPRDVQRNTTVIHNGADHYPVANRDEIRKFRKQHGFKQSDIVVLWVGRIQPQRDPQPYKGLKDIIKLAPQLVSENSKLKVLVAGKGEQNVREIFNDAGIYLELNVPRERMPVVYGAADIFLSTSVWEGFNLPLAEAQMQSTPVVALDLCAHPEVVADGYSGFLEKTVNGLKDRILELATDHDLRKTMAANARKHITQFTWDANTAALEKLMLDCLKIAGQPKQQIRVEINKSPRYFLDYGQYLIQRFGWKTFLKECVGWIRRRL